MNNVWVRPFDVRNPDEFKLLAEWLYVNREKNRFDPKLFERDAAGNFIRCRVLTCFDATGIVGFVPVTVAFLLESLAFKPDLHPMVEARALQAVSHHLVHRASEQHVPDAFFVTTDQSVLDFAKKYGWKIVCVPTLNLHFDDLEPKHESNHQSGS